MQPEAVSVADAAKIIGLGMTKTYELVNAGTLHSIKIGRRRLVRVDSIRQLVAA
ncbi:MULTISPECIES: helix-turn-helix domain-containing protein [unclassified Sphingomonas]|jgi:excisionase family DNA binding protein|uniref:helix-turn-helix domain-containing protein n=1 Tax=unclassified Sphingomonas TaxID=196159 RepID=UPI00226ABF73|nr:MULTISPECIES: helix-turn-helix domain-containing protein [unclassified Sphingomonas]